MVHDHRLGRQLHLDLVGYGDAERLRLAERLDWRRPREQLWRSGAVACAALADSLDERYGARSRRRIEIPNAMLQVMVDNLKAEAYQLRMRIVTRAASRGAPVEPAPHPQDHSHVEEELSEGDIQGSFAHGI